MMNRISTGIAAAILAISAGVSSPIRTMIGGIPSMSKFKPRRQVGGSAKRKSPLEPKVIRLMQLQAGIREGMDRSRRRLLAREFAKKLTAAAIASGATAGMSRAQVRTRQKAVAQLVGGALVRA